MTTHAPAERPRAATAGRRTDVQGLRAFAVLAVFFEHLLGWPAGGFVGVDIFFVISGFLITGLLLREYSATGTISFASFYVARIKRIIPAATLVLVVTVIAAHSLLLANRAAAITGDAVWAFLFSANWRFAAEGTDYFAQGQAVSPLQHFWSLSVEEQFYFVWPWLLLGILWIYARLRAAHTDRTLRLTAGAAMLVIIAASLAWAFVQSTTGPTVAYFSTFTRAWELGAGALLAVVAPLFLRLRQPVRIILAWLGLAGMTASLFLVDGGTPFPAPGALLPVLATVLVLASGIGEQARGLALLTNPVATYLGDISYSLYLWHFPAVVFGAALFPNSGSVGYIGVLVVGVGIAALAYHLFERPLHRSPLLTRHEGAWERREAWSIWWKAQLEMLKVARWVGLGAAGLATAAVVGFAFLVPADTANQMLYGTREAAAALPAPSGGPAAAADATPDPAAAAAGPAQSELTAKITAALRSASWPEGFENSFSQGGWPAEIEDCADPIRITGTECTWGDGERLAVVVGDSTAVAYTAALRSVLNEAGYRVQGFAMNGCEYSDTVIGNASVADSCPVRKQDAVDAITAQSPDLVFVTNAYQQHTPIGTDDPLTGPEWISSLQTAVERFRPAAGQVVFLSPPPADTNVGECFTAVSTPTDCVGDITASHQKYLAADATVAGALDGVVISSVPWFCAEDLCPAYVDSTPTKGDRLHAAPRYMDLVEPSIAESLRSAGVLP
ncbi:acyltransferase family protein [Rathayibacter sp. VKM Ac-2927]|uniref:acyltransferase family protein n=1 Tax=Rathayibacter sp. VKM Ac-2927 TaxID=2929478 RepID=UPI001FB28E20|nr:acyltransferase family protein [Rathayibacter sp. VKM Ac-2927]MCJ1685685.1 acyltransferase [Rathayibacter sp. VKM Ac-2927]